jgi:hypothetical protein
MKIIYSLIFLFCISVVSLKLQAQPYHGTIFIDPGIITSSDPSTLVSTTYTGQGMRTVYDRRILGWTSINAYLFDIVWDDGLTCEAQINPEFGSVGAATLEAEKYALVIGRLPTCLREDVNALWIHLGVEPFGGGNNSILIHTGQSASYESQGILEETLVHEASHTSLDAGHAASPGWTAAQAADPNFISTYAAANPTTEDVAESFLTWLAIRQCSIRISQQNQDSITMTIPNRISYFDNQNFSMYPLCMITGTEEYQPPLLSLYPNPANEHLYIRSEAPLEKLEIYSLEGKLVLQQQLNKEYTIPVSGIRKGMYLVSITGNDGERYLQKWIKD